MCHDIFQIRWFTMLIKLLKLQVNKLVPYFRYPSALQATSKILITQHWLMSSAGFLSLKTKIKSFSFCYLDLCYFPCVQRSIQIESVFQKEKSSIVSFLKVLVRNHGNVAQMLLASISNFLTKTCRPILTEMWHDTTKIEECVIRFVTKDVTWSVRKQRRNTE